MMIMRMIIYIYEPFDESHLVDRLFIPTCRMSWDFQHGLVDQLLATCWSPSTQRKLVSSLPTELMLAAMKFIHSTRWWFGTCGLWLSIQLGISSSQLTLTPSFFRGVGLNHQPDDASSIFQLVPGHILPGIRWTNRTQFPVVQPGNGSSTMLRSALFMFSCVFYMLQKNDGIPT